MVGTLATLSCKIQRTPATTPREPKVQEEKILVTIRMHPLNWREQAVYDLIAWNSVDDHTIFFENLNHEHPVTQHSFDRVFDPSCATQKVYEERAKDVALFALRGINGLDFILFFFVSSLEATFGRTFTMRGINENAVKDIYEHVKHTYERDFVLKLSALDIYNETVVDLFNCDSGCLRLLDDLETIESSLRENSECVKSFLASLVISDKRLVKHLQKEVGRLEVELQSLKPSLASCLKSLLMENELKIQEVVKCLSFPIENEPVSSALNTWPRKMIGRHSMLMLSATSTNPSMLVHEIWKLEQRQRQLGEEANWALEYYIRREGTPSRQTNLVDVKKMQKMFKNAVEENIRNSRAYIIELNEYVAKLQYQKQLLVLELEEAKEVGIKEIDSIRQSPMPWHQVFEDQRKQIVMLWHLCHHLVELGNASPALLGDEPIGLVASSIKSLKQEREYLAKRVSSKLTVEERKMLYLKWEVPVVGKQRRLQLVNKLWTNPLNMQHVHESIVAKLVGFCEFGEHVSKEMFELNFVNLFDKKSWM
ncbi:hypothetical protein DITRI_Ditri03aG0030200 [Diplodiscus trichospermus]